jgi:hydrogenase-4 membrane subunit HyfE
MITIQWVVYMVVGCCVCFGVLFLLYSFMAKQVAKQTAEHKEEITFVRSLISLIAESLKK